MSNAVLNGKSTSGKARREGNARTSGVTAGATTCTTPCCEVRIEACTNGCKIYCSCDDAAVCKTLQNLCRTLDGGLCSVQCTCDDRLCCECCFVGCNCTCEMQPNGVCICCTTTDANCLSLVQAMCRCLSVCCTTGCCCTICLNDKPVCCCQC